MENDRHKQLLENDFYLIINEFVNLEFNCQNKILKNCLGTYKHRKSQCLVKGGLNFNLLNLTEGTQILICLN